MEIDELFTVNIQDQQLPLFGLFSPRGFVDGTLDVRFSYSGEFLVVFRTAHSIAASHSNQLGKKGYIQLYRDINFESTAAKVPIRYLYFAE
jgi:hypothetical protein